MRFLLAIFTASLRPISRSGLGEPESINVFKGPWRMCPGGFAGRLGLPAPPPGLLGAAWAPVAVAERTGDTVDSWFSSCFSSADTVTFLLTPWISFCIDSVFFPGFPSSSEWLFPHAF